MFDDDEEFGEPQSSPQKKTTNAKQKISRFLTGLVLLALIGAVLYLLSEKNARTYFLVPEQGKLIVKKGRFLPLGEVAYVQNDAALNAAYAPLRIPGFSAQLERASFSERADLDQALAGHLLNWSKTYVKRNTKKSIAAAIPLLERVAILPVTSSQQKADLDELYREVSFFQGRESLVAAKSKLDESLNFFKQAQEAKSKIATQAKHAVGEIGSLSENVVSLLKIIDGEENITKTASVATSTPAKE